ncbi:MAG: SUMF1/EgtB/PvdO family nonheme iron enzyme [Kofleriaceae bacterium]
MTQMRWLGVALAVVACGKHSDGDRKQGGSGSAVSERDKGEPKVAAPPPLVKGSDKGDCKTTYAPRPTRDPNAMCKVAGGTFAMGEQGSGRTVKLSPYYVDQFEVTNAQVLHYLRATGADDSCPQGITTMQQSCFLVSNSSPIRKQSDGSYALKAGTEHHPFNLASVDGARQYCAWAGKSLPTEPQWEFAARHDPAANRDLLYPWGDVFDGTRANCFQNDCPGQPQEVIDIGTYDGAHGHGNGRSPWGLYEMAGNAAEFVADCVSEPVPCQGPCVDPPPATAKAGQECGYVTRGGGVDPRDALLTSARDKGMSHGGFRCARPVP